MQTTRTQDVDAATARRLAVQADVDPRTVVRELKRPGSVRGMAGHRLRSVLAAAHGVAAAPGTTTPDSEAR